MWTRASDTCPWVVRWWHARKRRIDALTAIQALVERAPPGKLIEAIHLFWLMEGQEHWWCPCASADRRLYLETFDTLEDGVDLADAYTESAAADATDPDR